MASTDQFSTSQEHQMTIQIDQLDADAVRVVQRLRRFDHEAYIVGGCVRDLLLGKTPKDYDVSTSATPQDLRRMFRNCRIIGRRFRLAHIFFGQKIIETATFRANPREGDSDDKPQPAETTEISESKKDLLIRRDNVFGTAEQDALRRDFTVNGLFLDVDTGEVIDHVGGLKDIEARLVRTIGDPNVRFREDPVRILRAVKFAARCELSIEPETYEAIVTNVREIEKCPHARVSEEFFRLMRAGAGRKSIELLCELKLLPVIAPKLAHWLANGEPFVSEPADGSSAEEASGQNAASPSELETEGGTLLDLQAPNNQGSATTPDATPSSAQSNPEALAANTETSKAEAPPIDGEPTQDAEQVRFWRYVEALDETTKSKAGSPSNAVVLATLLLARIRQALSPDNRRGVDVGRLIASTLGPLVEELKVSKRDGESARQLLISLRYVLPSKRGRSRRRPRLSGRELRSDLSWVADIIAHAEGLSRDDLPTLEVETPNTGSTAVALAGKAVSDRPIEVDNMGFTPIPRVDKKGLEPFHRPPFLGNGRFGQTFGTPRPL